MKYLHIYHWSEVVSSQANYTLHIFYISPTLPSTDFQVLDLNLKPNKIPSIHPLSAHDKLTLPKFFLHTFYQFLPPKSRIRIIHPNLPANILQCLKEPKEPKERVVKLIVAFSNKQSDSDYKLLSKPKHSITKNSDLCLIILQNCLLNI